jgi:hypothetical protein
MHTRRRRDKPVPMHVRNILMSLRMRHVDVSSIAWLRSMTGSRRRDACEFCSICGADTGSAQSHTPTQCCEAMLAPCRGSWIERHNEGAIAMTPQWTT